MKRLLVLACLFTLLACGKPADQASRFQEAHPQKAATALAAYNLEVTFDGLIAFVKQDVDSNPAVWALLVDADYDPQNPDKDLLPECALDQFQKIDIPEIFPPHIPALRIKNADVDLNGVSLGGLVQLFLIKGLDLRFDTGKKNPTITPSPMVTRDIFAAILNGKPDDFKHHDTLKKDYVEDFATAMAAKHLAARALIDFGDSAQADVLSCPSVTRTYSMKLNISDQCKGNTTPLAESFKVLQAGLMQPVEITLDGSRKLTIKPKTAGDTVTIEILNIIPSALADPHYLPCNDPHLHPAAFRWYFRLLDDSTTAHDCKKHYFPCLIQSAVGGTKCPQMEMQTP